MSLLPDVIEIIPRKENNVDGDLIIPYKLPILDKAELLGDDISDDMIKLRSYNDDDMMSMVHVAFKLHGDFKN